MQAGIEFVDYAIDAMPEKSAQIWNKQAVENCPKRKRAGNRHNFCHLCRVWDQ